MLAEAFRLTVASLLHDKEPPVKVEAAIAVQMMLTSKGESARKYLEPQIRYWWWCSVLGLVPGVLL